MGSEHRWDAGRVVAFIAVWLAAVTTLRTEIAEPGVGASFLSLVAICVAAYRFGHAGAIAVAAVSTALFIASEMYIRSDDELLGVSLLMGGATRGIVFLGVGLLVAELLRLQDRLTRTVASQEQEISELEAVRDALIPRSVPEVPGLRLATAFTPAEGQVAGDFFLVVPRSDGSALLAVGDVVGHGLQAARRASLARATLANFAGYASDPAELLRLANAALYDRGEQAVEFVTATCVQASPHDGTLTWAQAGHPPPWDLDSGEPLADWTPCAPLGVDEDLACITRSFRLPRGGGLLLFTDGLVEARPTHRSNGELRLFGEEGVREQLWRHRGAPPERIVAALNSAAIRFAGGSLADDLTVLAARFEGLSR